MKEPPWNQVLLRQAKLWLGALLLALKSVCSQAVLWSRKSPQWWTVPVTQDQRLETHCITRSVCVLWQSKGSLGGRCDTCIRLCRVFVSGPWVRLCVHTRGRSCDTIPSHSQGFEAVEAGQGCGRALNPGATDARRQVGLCQDVHPGPLWTAEFSQAKSSSSHLGLWC